MDTEKVQRLDGFGYLRREFRVTNSVEPPGKCLRYSLIIVAKQCMCSCWDELTQTAEKRNGYNHMVGKYATNVGLIGNANSPRIYYIPLMFWFNRNPGLSLPLIALQLTSYSCQKHHAIVNDRNFTWENGRTPINSYLHIGQSIKVRC